MAAFYPNSSAEVDVISTPYVQDQKFTSYSDSPIIHGNMMMYINGPSSDRAFSEVGPGASMSVDIRSMAGRNEMMFIPPTVGGQSNATEGDTAMHSLPEEMLFTSRGQLSVVDGDRSFHGLSLSLSTQFSNAGLSPLAMAGNSKDWPYDLHGEGPNSTRFGAPNNLQELVKPKDVGYSANQYEQAGNARFIMKSRFVKAAQQLLDEVVNVQDALKQHDYGKDQNVSKVEEGPSESEEKSAAASDVNGSATASCQELSATERQELQNKLDKLLAMLNEVDRRYKQYYHQMQVMESSFDLVAGCGAAKPYTTLALKTISRHFRSLRDATSVQIQATRKSLGEQDSGQGGVIPRLRYVDQQLRQQRALQQFGMMRHAWRPQRGLPENAVTTLRAWLFEHFLNPYPKDSEKIMLARQTGLTRGQVANWFINARVRLWKPMVEEMYKEEFGEAELSLKSSSENASNAAGETSRTFEDQRDELQERFRSMTDSGHPGPSHDESKINVNHHTPEMNQSINKLHDNHNSMDNHTFYAHDHNGLMSFHVPELGSYGVNNQVSLALGLRRIDGDVGHFSAGTTLRPSTSAENAVGPEANEYSYYDPGNQQHKFGNSHLLDDFVV